MAAVTGVPPAAAAAAAVAAPPPAYQAAMEAMMARLSVSNPQLGGFDTTDDFQRLMPILAAEWHVRLQCEQQGIKQQQWQGGDLRAVKLLVDRMMEGRGWRLPFDQGHEMDSPAAMAYLDVLRRMAGEEEVLAELRR
jgi:hypothetical protein